MFLSSIIVCSLLAQVFSRPQEPAQVAGSTPIAIVSQNEEINPDGTFKYSYETANGIKVEQTGYLKDDPSSTDKIQVIEGSVSYTDNDGQAISLKYIADENGFQPQGDHLPTPPPSSGGAEVKSLPEQPAAKSVGSVAPKAIDLAAAKPTPEPIIISTPTPVVSSDAPIEPQTKEATTVA